MLKPLDYFPVVFKFEHQQFQEYLATLQTYGHDKYIRTLADVIMPNCMNLNQELCKNLTKWLFLPVISPENPSITPYFESHLNALKICNGLRHPDQTCWSRSS
jgi:hypothetical protein